MPGFPTVIVLGADGIELDRTIGFDGDAEKFVMVLQDWSQNKNTLYAYLTEWAKDASDVEWNYRIAERYIDRYQDELALRFWHNILSLDPENKTGYRKAAEFNVALHAARRAGNPTQLAVHLEREMDLERLKLGYLALARVYEGQNDVPNAVKVYQAALEKLPDNTNIMNSAAWFIYEQKATQHYAWGIKTAQRAVELEPQAASIWDTLAWLYHSDGQYHMAVQAMSKAVALEPDIDYFKQSLQKMKNDLQKNS